jgi:hypothetical protein
MVESVRFQRDVSGGEVASLRLGFTPSTFSATGNHN